MNRYRTLSGGKKQSPFKESSKIFRSKSKEIVDRIKLIYNFKEQRETLVPSVVGIRINSQPNPYPCPSPSPHKSHRNLKIKIPIKSKTPNSKSPACISRREPQKMNSPEVMTERLMPVPKLEELKKKQADSRPLLGTQKFFRKEKEKQNKMQMSHLSETLRLVWERRPKKASRPEFKMIKELGKSQIGDIIQAVSNNTGIVAALKTFNKAQLKLEFLIDQMKIHMFCNHPNILPAYGYHISKDWVYLVMEVGECNLYDRLVKYAPFDQLTVADYVSQITAGVAYLHQLGVMHRDIKPENIIIIGGCLKIADFGWSIRTNKPRKTLCGTLDYLSPEVSYRKEYTNKIDCWSIGVLMYELLTGQPPFPDQKEQICAFKQIAFPSKLSPLGQDLLQKTLEMNPINRLSARQILQHEWITTCMNRRRQGEGKRFRGLQHDFLKVFQ